MPLIKRRPTRKSKYFSRFAQAFATNIRRQCVLSQTNVLLNRDSLKTFRSPEEIAVRVTSLYTRLSFYNLFLYFL